MKRLRTEFKLVRLVALIPSLQIAKASDPERTCRVQPGRRLYVEFKLGVVQMDLLSEAP